MIGSVAEEEPAGWVVAGAGVLPPEPPPQAARESARAAERECDQSFRQFHFSTSLKFNRVGSFLWVCVCVIFRSATLHFFSMS